MPKSFFVDTSRCTACRGCQIACKEWNELPANKTKQYGWGSHQNPPDLNPRNYKLVRFNEHLDGDRVRWNFFPDQCRHCLEPPCKEVADDIVEGAVIQDTDTGAVIFTAKTKEIGEDDAISIREACPYDIPRRDEQTGLMSKCTMCNERVKSGMLPACVKVCPTGTMNFGDRKDMLALAEERLAKLKKDHPKAQVVDEEYVSVIYLITEDPEYYHTFVVADAQDKRGMDRKKFLAKAASPVARVFKAMG